MPLTRMQFDLGIDAATEEWMRKIHTFLAAHHDLAYTLVEIAHELNAGLFPQPVTDQREDASQSFFVALLTLVATGHVKQNEVRGVQYYAAITDNLEL